MKFLELTVYSKKKEVQKDLDLLFCGMKQKLYEFFKLKEKDCKQ